jgi:hypothetical protein
MHKLGSNSAPWIVVLGTLTAGATMAFPPDPDLPPNDSDWLRPFVGYQYSYDDNLFRLPSVSDYPAAYKLLQPGASAEDHINTALAGLDGNWIVGRQSVDYDLEVDENRFERNSFLNNTSGTAKAVWNWSVGSTLTGTAGANYTRALGGFEDTFYYERNVVDRVDYFGSGRYQIGPRWGVYGSVDDAETRNSAGRVSFNNFDLQSGKVGTDFATSLQNTFGFEYRFSHGHYPDPDASLSVKGVNVEGVNGIVMCTPSLTAKTTCNMRYDPDYDENSGAFVAKYVVSDKTQLSGDVGYLRRNYPNATVGAFSGEIWHANALWQPTDKTSVQVLAGRDLAAYLYSQSDYFVQDGITVTPTWKQTDKITWSAVLSWYRQNYISSSASSVILVGARHDNLSMQQLSLTYTPYRFLLFNFIYHHEQRGSTVPELGYADDTVQVGAKFRF